MPIYKKCRSKPMANLLFLIDAITIQIRAQSEVKLKKKTMKVTLVETVTERYKFAS